MKKLKFISALIVALVLVTTSQFAEQDKGSVKVKAVVEKPSKELLVDC